MASGREVHVEDLPPELMETKNTETPSGDWEKALRHWADQALACGQKDILSEAVPTFEKALIETALKHTAGRKRDAANLLGWGRKHAYPQTQRIRNVVKRRRRRINANERPTASSLATCMRPEPQKSSCRGACA